MVNFSNRTYIYLEVLSLFRSGNHEENEKACVKEDYSMGELNFRGITYNNVRIFICSIVFCLGLAIMKKMKSLRQRGL